MSNKFLTQKAHSLTVRESNIKFLKNNNDYPFIGIKLHGADRETIVLNLDKSLAEKMFLFLEGEYEKEIEQIKSEMYCILKKEELKHK